VQSRNATNSDGDRVNLQREFSELQNEIGRVIRSSSFNTKPLFDGSAGTMEFQVGANAQATDRISIGSIDLLGTAISAGSALDMTSTAITDADVLSTVVGGWDGTSGVSIGGTASGGTTVASVSQIDDAMNVIDRALSIINDKRAIFGAVQNRFEAVIGNLQTPPRTRPPPAAASWTPTSPPRTAALSRAQILQQAGNAMVAQANQLPQQVLSLLAAEPPRRDPPRRGQPPRGRRRPSPAAARRDELHDAQAPGLKSLPPPP
jgi:flagellin